MKKTKIIGTIGPSSESDENLIALYERGLNVIRINFSHAKHDHTREIIDRVKKLNASGKTEYSFLLDTKGPEIRTGDVPEKIPFQKGEEFIIYTTELPPVEGKKSLFCDYVLLAEDVKAGWVIEIDSGLFHVRVVSTHTGYIVVRAENDALIGSRRHINLPWVSLRLPGMTDKDRSDILLGIELWFHFIAASFIRTAQNVRDVRSFLDEHGWSAIRRICKIENEEGMLNLEEITDVSDGIMVARGDLGIEMPIAKIPLYQAQIVELCRKKGKIVVVATQMIESMMEYPYPTRAEVGDIFNAIRQGTDATMLSGETAMGKYPLEAVAMMTRVIEEAESVTKWENESYSDANLSPRDIEKKALIRSAISTADILHARAVVIFTKSGLLARLAAAFRPSVPVFAFTWEESSKWFMNILYGIQPVVLTGWDGNYESNLLWALEWLQEKQWFTLTDKVVVITDLQREKREIPVMEIISLADILKVS